MEILEIVGNKERIRDGLKRLTADVAFVKSLEENSMGRCGV